MSTIRSDRPTRLGSRTAVGVYDDYEAAEKVVTLLQEHGIKREYISVLDREQVLQDALSGTKNRTRRYVIIGLISGVIAGSIIGIFVGIMFTTVPGFEQIFFNANPLSVFLTNLLLGVNLGAALGALIGWIVAGWVPKKEWHFSTAGVQQSGVVIMVRTDVRNIVSVVKILNQQIPDPPASAVNKNTLSLPR